jgi:hypothetical protein
MSNENNSQVIPKGSSVMPSVETIDALKDKYKNVNINHVVSEYHKLTKALFDIQIKLRELNIIYGYEQMTSNQKHLMHICDSNQEKFKVEASYNNVVAIHDGNHFYNHNVLVDELTESIVSYRFFKDVNEAVDYTDTLPIETQAKILVTPLFIAI